MHLEAPRGELVGHDLRGPLLLEGGLGMTVDVTTDGSEIGQVVGEKIGCVTGHERRLASAVAKGNATPVARRAASCKVRGSFSLGERS